MNGMCVEFYEWVCVCVWCVCVGVCVCVCVCVCVLKHCYETLRSYSGRWEEDKKTAVSCSACKFVC